MAPLWRAFRVGRQTAPRRCSGQSRPMTQCNRHGPRIARLHDSSVGAVPADADRSVDGRPSGPGLPAWRRSAGAGIRHDLSADAARLPAGAAWGITSTARLLPLRSCGKWFSPAPGLRLSARCTRVISVRTGPMLSMGIKDSTGGPFRSGCASSLKSAERFSRRHPAPSPWI